MILMHVIMPQQTGRQHLSLPNEAISIHLKRFQKVSECVFHLCQEGLNLYYAKHIIILPQFCIYSLVFQSISINPLQLAHLGMGKVGLRLFLWKSQAGSDYYNNFPSVSHTHNCKTTFANSHILFSG